MGEEGKGEMGPSDRKQGASDCKASGRRGQEEGAQSGEGGGDSPGQVTGGGACTDQRSRGQGGRGPSRGRSPEGQGLGSWLKEWMGVEVRGTEGSLTQFAGRC